MFKIALRRVLSSRRGMRILRVLAPALLIIIAGVTAMGNTYTVTKTSMGGSSAGRLDTAITSANSNAGTDTIAFNIPTADAGYDAARGVWRISLTGSTYRSITGPTIIDGTTQTTNKGNTNATYARNGRYRGRRRHHARTGRRP